MKQPTELIIVDPLNNSNNVGRPTAQFNNVKMAFRISFYSTQDCCDCSCHYHDLNDKEEHCLLKRMFKSVKRFQQFQETEE